MTTTRHIPWLDATDTPAHATRRTSDPRTSREYLMTDGTPTAPVIGHSPEAAVATAARLVGGGSWRVVRVIEPIAAHPYEPAFESAAAHHAAAREMERRMGLGED